MRTFLVQNKKSTKRNLQAFRLTEAQILYLSEIGSPHGCSMNAFIEPSGGDTSGTSRRNHADVQQHLKFMLDGALAPFDKRYFY